MDALREYLAMGGFAWFIWPTYVLTIGFMIWIAASTWRGLRADKKTLEQLEQNAPHRQRRAAASAERQQQPVSPHPKVSS